jgi:hypothetical protein
MDVAICLLISSRCRDPLVRCCPKTAKTTFSAAASDLDLQRPLCDDIDAEINDRKC